MKKKLIIPLLLVVSFSACKREELALVERYDQKVTLTRKDAKHYIEQMIENNPDSLKAIRNLDIEWESATSSQTSNGNIWKITLSGQPTYQNIKQGYRELAIKRNLENGQISARINEVIPDAIYLQKQKQVNRKTFTGRIFQYDLSYHLDQGYLYSNGKIIGEIASANKVNENIPSELRDLNPIKGMQGKLMRMRTLETCSWFQDSYIDSNGEFTVHSERICNYFDYDDGTDYWAGGWISDGGYTGGGAGNPDPDPAPPTPSNLPGADNNKVDPKKMMDCFSTIANPNAAFVIRIYVIEPQPGTSFNVGANSFGHVAISLSKTSGNTTITQTIGYYPTGAGLNKLESKAQILDNGFDSYNMSVTYYVNNDSFQKVINYISNPPTQYHFTEFNCTAFVYAAGKAGGIPLPDPTTQIGLSGAGGAGFAKTPAGMASALRSQKASNPSLDINEAGGRIPASKGPCN